MSHNILSLYDNAYDNENCTIKSYCVSRTVFWADVISSS